MEYPTANLSLEDFNKIIESNQLTFVDFYATWCEPCKYLDEILAELEPQISSISKIIKLDVDEQVLLAQEFGIRSVPTIMIFKKGELKWRMAGFMLVHELEEKIKSFVF